MRKDEVELRWHCMRGNDNKWGGMKMAFGKWEKNENMTMQEIKLRGQNMTILLQRNDNAWNKSQMTLDDIK